MMIKSMFHAHRIPVVLFLLTLTMYGCGSLPSKERWLTPTPKTPPQPEEQILGQAPQWNDYISGSVPSASSQYDVPKDYATPKGSSDPWGGSNPQVNVGVQVDKHGNIVPLSTQNSPTPTINPNASLPAPQLQSPPAPWLDYSSDAATPIQNPNENPNPATPAQNAVPGTLTAAQPVATNPIAAAPIVADPWGAPVGTPNPAPMQAPPYPPQIVDPAAPKIAQAVPMTSVPMSVPQQGMVAQPLPNGIPPQYAAPQHIASPNGLPQHTLPQLPQTPDLWANGASPEVPVPQAEDPWGLNTNAPVRQAVSIEAAAQKEEDEREKARLADVAAAKKPDGKADYLQPFDHPDGPFADRVQKTDTERELVRQVGYYEVSQKKYDNFPVYDWEKEEKKAFDWEMLDPVNMFSKIRDWVGLGPDEKKAIAAMKKGREIIDPIQRDLSDPKKCTEAGKEFATAAWRWPDSVLEEDALHLAGECYYFAGDYPHALKYYQKLIIKYQHSPHLDKDVRRLFAIARYWEKEAQRGVSSVNMTEKSRPTFDTFGWSKKAYETIFINDPNGPISDDAVMALASAYLARGKYQGDDNYDQAAYYFNYLRENFPLSKHVAKAHELELYARTSAYMGAEYNSKTLDEAGKLADVTLRQFGAELGDDKGDVVALKESVVQRQAEREWIMGQYYDKKKYYGSARQYYEKLLDKYPQTVYAEKARQRIEEIQDRPTQPSNFDILKKAFTAR